jgi:adenylate kinase
VRGIVGICGTPGTGKKTVAPIVASLLGLPAPVSLNSLVRKGEDEVDPRALRRSLLKLKPGRAVVFGHLLPHVLNRPEVAAVALLRCDPSVLRERLVERQYPAAKVAQNVEAELIGVVLDECVRRFGDDRVREYDTTSASPEKVAAAIARYARKGASPSGKRKAWIDWTLDYGSSIKLRSLLGGGRDPGST